MTTRKVLPRSTPGKADIPPALAPLVKLISAAVLQQLRAGADQAGTDRRVRHDRIALPRRAALAAIHAGDLPAIKIGRFWYVEPADLESYYEAHRDQAPPAGSPANDGGPEDVAAAEELVLEELGLERKPERKRAKRRGAR